MSQGQRLQTQNPTFMIWLKVNFYSCLYQGTLTLSTNVRGIKRKQSKGEEDETSKKVRIQEEIDEFEVRCLKVLNKCMGKLEEAVDTDEFHGPLQLIDTLLQYRSKVVPPLRQGNSIDIMIKFVSATHLESLQGALDALKSSLMADLLNSPDLVDFDLSEVVIDLSVSEDVLLECINNLYESK